MGLGLIAALGQAGISTAITGPVLVAVLATIAGVIIVGVGGGMVRPMQQRWERMLDTAERDMRGASGGIGAYRRGHSDAMAGQQATTARAVPSAGTGGEPGGAPQPM